MTYCHLCAYVIVVIVLLRDQARNERAKIMTETYEDRCEHLNPSFNKRAL